MNAFALFGERFCKTRSIPTNPIFSSSFIRCAVALIIAASAEPAFSGFPGTDAFIPAVARIQGQFGANFCSTLWITNLSGSSAQVEVRFHEADISNTNPARFFDTLGPSETKRYDNILETRFQRIATSGALRIISDRDVYASSRTYDLAAGGNIRDSKGLFFSAIPTSFSIASNESGTLQGVSQGGSEDMRYNFGLLETGGNAVTVEVDLLDGSGVLLAAPKLYTLPAYGRVQYSVSDILPSIATTNASLVAKVVGGTGRVLFYGTQIANGSNDSAGFEMSFKTSLLAAAVGGGSGVTSLNMLTGALTIASGANTTVSQAGSTITINATGGPGGSLPTGTASQTLYDTGSAWASSSALTNDGTNVAITGTLALPNPLLITSGGQTFLSAGMGNTFVGRGSGAVTTGNHNTFLGVNAGLANTTGANNTFLGRFAGGSSAATTDSTAIGNSAYVSGTAGGFDTAVGSLAMSAGAGTALGGYNTAVGYSAYQNGPAGRLNTAVGTQALASAASGDHNTAVGNAALGSATSGDDNVAIGSDTLFNLTSGSTNTALGRFAGQSLTSGSGNLYLANSGAATESNVTRIGGTQTSAFIAGVRGVTTGSGTGIPVLIDSNGQLGTVSSSALVKDDIRDMSGESAKLMQLRPVTFRYKAHGPDGPKQFGLIAEEVDAVMPELVARSNDGRIETVMYHELPSMLLNEIQKQQRAIDALKSERNALQAEHDALGRMLRELSERVATLEEAGK